MRWSSSVTGVVAVLLLIMVVACLRVACEVPQESLSWHGASWPDVGLCAWRQTLQQQCCA
jgi:hypothetical protein